MSGAVWDIQLRTTEIVISSQPPVLLSALPVKPQTFTLGNVVSLLAHHLQRWPNDETTSGECFLLDSSLMCTPFRTQRYPVSMVTGLIGYTAAIPNDPLINPSTSRWVCQHNHVLQQIRWADDGLMLGQRRRLCTSISPALDQRLLLHG